jgi:cysteine desulfurase
MTRLIYLDYNATTPVDPAVRDALLPYLGERFGNPSSTHAYGQEAHHAVDHARQHVADLLDAQPDEIIFTGGGTEASNLAIKGVLGLILFGTSGQGGCLTGTIQGSWLCRLRSLLGRTSGKVQVITSAIEHPATLRPCQWLGQLGCRIEVLPVDKHGVVDVEALKLALQRPTALVSIMHSNNEVGTLQPIAEIARLAHEQGALVHCDAAQSVGKLPINVKELGVDLLTVAGHKVYAPKGVGALYVRRGVPLEPVILGAGHEGGRRAGTENVPYLVGLGEAARLARSSLPEETTRLRSRRERLWQGLHEQLGDSVVLNGHPAERLPNTLNVSFRGWVGSELLAATPGVAASTGSACHQGLVQISPVLQAMGIAPEIAQGAVRLSVGRFTTDDEIDQVCEHFIKSAWGGIASRVHAHAPAR